MGNIPPRIRSPLRRTAGTVSELGGGLHIVHSSGHSSLAQLDPENLVMAASHMTLDSTGMMTMSFTTAA
jgi:hypothetical protein